MAGRARRFWVICLILVGLLSAGAYYAVARPKRAQPAAPAAGPRPVPVATATAPSGDIGVYLTGLGTVTAFNTVTVRSRVDGQLMRVAFEEGQMVQAGRSPRRDRPAAVRGAAGAGRRPAGARPGRSSTNARSTSSATGAARAGSIAQQQSTRRQRSCASSRARPDRPGQIDNAKLQLTYSGSPRRSAAASGCAWSTPATSSSATDANGLVVITQVEPIAVLFTMPEDDLPRVMRRLSARRHARRSTPTTATAEEARHAARW